jgi:hypothetical protein
MTLQELMPEIENLSQEDKTEIFNYLLKDLGAEGDYLMGCIHNPELMADAVRTLQELLQEENAKAKV